MAATGNLPKVFKVEIRDAFSIMIFGVLFFLLGNILWLNALNLIPSSVFGMISNLSPLMALIMAYFILKEYISKSNIFGFSLAIIGVSLIVLTDSVIGISLNPLGVALALSSVVLFALGTVVLKRMLYKYTPYQVAFLMYIGGISSILVFSFLRVGFLSITGLPLSILWLVLFLGISAGMAEIFYFYCLSKLDVSKVVYFQYLGPICIVVFSYIILNEIITYMFVIGTVFVLVGMKYALGKS